VEVRELQPSEFQEAGQVTAAAYHEFSVGSDDPEGWRAYLSRIADVAGRAGKTLVLGALQDGRVLGTATLEMDQTLGDDDVDLPPDTASLRMLGVAPDARGTGVGRALVEACIERAREGGKSVLVLRTTDRMASARRLYEALGFRRDAGRDHRLDDGEVLAGYRLDL
jgi:ribosomal protein S18 acetylase RimI-like enzyme